MLEGLSPRPGGPPSPPRAPKALTRFFLLATLAVALLLSGLGAPHSTWNNGSGLSSALVTTGFNENFNLSRISLPGFNPLTGYTDNYHGQYPVYDYTGKYAGCLVYIDNSSRLDYFCPVANLTGAITAPLTLLYQTTPGLEAQVDNEFQLDTPYDVALLYGNLTTSAGDLTVETAFLSNGTVRSVTTPDAFVNDLQADYIGNGNVAIFSSNATSGFPSYFVNVFNGTSWLAGPSVGIAANNIYWVWQLNAFLDVQGVHTTQFSVEGKQLVQTGSAWFNDSAIDTVSAVFGAVFSAGAGQVSVDLGTNAGSYVEVLNVAGGTLRQSGSYAYLSSYWFSIQRYSYTTSYVWANFLNGYGTSVLFDPFTDQFLSTPGLVGRQESSGGNGNYVFSSPYSTSTYVSLNGTLLGFSSLAPNQFIWAYQPSSPSVSGGGFPGFGLPSFLGLPVWGWVAAAVIVLGASVAFVTKDLKT
jgi:hypothetical protein